MRKYITSLSESSMIMHMLVFSFSLPVYLAIDALVSRYDGRLPIQGNLSNGLLLWGNSYLLISLLFACWCFQVRGFPLAKFGFALSWASSGLGVSLGASTWIVTFLAAKLLLTYHPENFRLLSVHRLSLVCVIYAAVVNSVYEEFFESGYLVRILERFGKIPTLLMISSGVALLHAYEGLNYMVLVFLGRAIFVLVYWKYRQLWPIVIAHCLIDLLSLVPLVKNADFSL